MILLAHIPILGRRRPRLWKSLDNRHFCWPWSQKARLLEPEHAGSLTPSKCSLVTDSSCIRIAVAIGNCNRALEQGRHAPATTVGVITKQSNQYGQSWSNVATPRPLDVKMDSTHTVRCSNGRGYLTGTHTLGHYQSLPRLLSSIGLSICILICPCAGTVNPSLTMPRCSRTKGPLKGFIKQGCQATDASDVYLLTGQDYFPLLVGDDSRFFALLGLGLGTRGGQPLFCFAGICAARAKYCPA
jgi:hypothetical protein